MKNEGFTLVEVIVGMALLGILAVFFLPLFSSQYMKIFKTGDRSETTHEVVKEMERKIANPEEIGTVEPGDSTEDVKIKFGTKETIEIEMKEVEAKEKNDEKDEEEKAKIEVAVPITEDNR